MTYVCHSPLEVADLRGVGHPKFAINIKNNTFWTFKHLRNRKLPSIVHLKKH